MFKSIIVPLDGSMTSRRAIDTAVIVGRTFGAPVQLVTVQSPGVDAFATELELQSISDDLHVPTEPPLVLASNEVAGALGELLERIDHPLLCMSTHGRSGLASVVLGSTARAVVAAVRSPVLLVGPHAVPSPHGSVVLAIASGTGSVDDVELAGQWAGALDSRLHLVSVLASGDATRERERDARQQLHALTAHPDARGADASRLLLVGADVAELLLETASRLAASVIVMRTRGNRGLAGMVLGSVTQQVVHRATCPVLAIPPQAAREM